ncbi:hypothetical protein BDV18DRAFT_34382 [Aspergillus unguis]
MEPVILFYGTFVDLPRTKSGKKHALSIKHGALWVSSSTGRISGFDWSVSGEEELQALIQKNGWNQSGVEIVRSREDENEFFFPGFIDTHIHAPQYPNSGLFGSSTLLDWLETYTFPLESSLSDLSKARRVYDTVISRTLANGTTYAAYYATIHVPATNLLATLCHNRGQRALIGRVCMDNPAFCPEYYRDESAEQSTAATKETIEHIHSLKSDLVQPILTPRFAPTCSPESLASLGKLAASHSPPLHIQTHISENLSELALVKELFPSYDNYSSVYDAFSLLTPRTILAHAVHLTPSEKQLIASRKTKVSHCPSSNSALGSGLAPVRSLLDAGIQVGLGTDVSGGYSPSILEGARQACLVSRLLRHTASSVAGGSGAAAAAASESNTQVAAPEVSSSDDENAEHLEKEEHKDEKKGGREVLSVEETLYLATRGGAAVVDMPDELGGFEVGMYWDVQLIRLGPSTESREPLSQLNSSSTSSSDSVVDVFGWENWTEKVHKWVWTGDDRNVKKVWVGGRLVHSLQDSSIIQSARNGLIDPGSWLKTRDWGRWAVGGMGVAAAGLVFGRRWR